MAGLLVGLHGRGKARRHAVGLDGGLTARLSPSHLRARWRWGLAGWAAGVPCYHALPVSVSGSQQIACKLRRNRLLDVSYACLQVAECLVSPGHHRYPPIKFRTMFFSISVGFVH